MARFVGALMLCSLLAAACSPAAPSRPADIPATGAAPPATAYPRPGSALRMALGAPPGTLAPKFSSGSSTAYHEMLNIFTSFLALYDPADVLRPMLVTRIPTIDNGDWVLNPDGTMLTTYHLRENARWHDGEPVTAHDFVFAYQVYVDPELPVVVRDPETLMEGVDAVDPATLQIRWKQPYFRANGLSVQSMVPLPAHLLEEKYRSARAGFADLPEFTTAWIGAGPYRLEHWEPGVSVLGRANLDWFLGPPKIETLEIRFITDPNTILANLLSGDADYTGSPFVRVPQATAARDQLAAGVLHAWSIKIQRLDFQYREVPNWQRAVSDLRVRRALMHGLDRAGLADLMTGGLDGPADAYIQRSDPFFPDVDAAVTRYPYDPARATALFEEAGWHRSAASGLLANAAGQSFGLELWASQQQEAAFVVDSWKKVGIDASIFMKPSTGLSAETRASFPTIDISNGPGSPEWFVFTSAHFPTAANRWSGQNHGSFHDDEVDRLQQLRLSAVDANARREAAVALYQRVSELVAVGVLYYMPEFFIAHRRLTGPVGSNTINPATFWNIYEWDLTD